MSSDKELFLTRAHVRHDAPVSALREVVFAGPELRTAAGHRLVWTLFGDSPERARDFLWREAEPGTFYLLSARPPQDRHGLFHVDPPRPFAPVLKSGDRIDFVLRANATVARKAVGKPAANGRVRGGRCDIVMDALHSIPRGERAVARTDLLPDVAERWIEGQGAQHGFALVEGAPLESWEAGQGDATRGKAIRVAGYRVLRVNRGTRAAPLAVGVLDIEGTLVVNEPARFVAAVAQGFGRARAFGCGLMLIRRSRGNTGE